MGNAVGLNPTGFEINENAVESARLPYAPSRIAFSAAWKAP
jgi:hypothetical protein